MRALALLGSMVCAASAAVIVPTSVGAAETHTDCVTVDDMGNILSVVPNCSETLAGQTQPPQVFPSPNPCNGDTGTITITTARSVFHVNVNGAGDVWATGTSTGTISFTPDDPSQPSAGGHTTSWFGVELNNRNSVMTDTFESTLRSTDGHTITVNGVDHVTLNANGTVTSKFSMNGNPICH